MVRATDRFRTAGRSLIGFDSTEPSAVVRGWLGFSAVMTVLGAILIGGWFVVGGSAAGFLAVVGLLFALVVGYSVSRSKSIASATAWFSEPNGMLLLALMVAFVVAIVALVL